ncbi:MAG: carbohydrate-binding domain-containing protein [Prevotella sp.]|nr:carbohydrate-binding domain-containing protein [Prevotella sp.]
MKKLFAMAIAALAGMAVQAQTLNVEVGSVVYQIPAAQAGEMVYENGQTVTIINKTYTLSDITQMYFDDTEVEDNAVSVVYNGTSAQVKVAGNVAQYLTVEVSGAHVSIAQSSDLAQEITYTLSGSSTDGEFYMSGSYKATVELDGLTLTNATPVYSGAAIDIQNGKRIDISVKKGTVNTLTDCASGSQKACLVVKGHAEFKGKGTLNIYGKVKHGIKSGEYMQVKNCTINVLEAVADGVHANEYFLMASGELNISGVGDDGLEAELDGTTSTGMTADHEDEDSGNIYIEGGTITASVTAADTKALKSDGDMTISGGTITLKATGTGGKCIKCDNVLTVSDDAVISATATGSSNSTYGSAKAIKAGTRTQTGGNSWRPTYSYSGGIVITGGTITASASSHEAIESKNTIDISGGIVYAYSSDDAINSASDFTISGGFVMGNSTGNDGLDANGDFYLKGGTVFAVATSSPEVGIDANTEESHKLYVTGGTIVAIGGLESGSSLSQSCYQASSYSKGTWYGLYNDDVLALAFKVPSNSRMGTPMVVSTSGTTTLKSGISVSDGTSIWDGFGQVDGTVSGGSPVTISSYTGGSGGSGGGGGPGGGGGHWW